MHFEDFAEYNDKIRVASSEFHSKIPVSYNTLVFLGLRGETTKDLEEVVKMAASRDGYEGHKTFSYRKKRICHFYIRFRNAACAQKAIVYFRAMDKKFNADVVKNILLTWYMIEMLLVLKDEKAEHVRTTAYVDVQGGSKFPNPLSISNVYTVLVPFGCPVIVPSNAPYPRMIEVLFSSMAEALGTAIATGRWFYYGEMEHRPSAYRVRIVGKEKEENIFTISGCSPSEAFGMDYFMPTSEVGPEDTESRDKKDPKDSFSGFKSPKKYTRSYGQGRNGNYKYQHSNSNHGSAKPTTKVNEIINTLGEDFKLIVNIS